MVGINEIMLSVLLLMPLSESREAIRQHLQTERTEIHVHSNLIAIGNTYKNKKDLEQKKIEEDKGTKQKLKEQEKKRRVEKPSRGGSVDEDIFILTFYTDLPSENGGYTVTCKGKKLRSGMVASNYHKLGTKIKLKGYGTVTVSDRGSSHFDKSNRLDVFVPRKGSESDAEYLKRVNNMGKVKVKGNII